MRQPALTDATILIVDDQDANVRLLEGLLEREGYARLIGTTDPRQVLALAAERQPDLILLDLHMPHLDGFQVLEQLGAAVPADTYLPILVLTADVTAEAKRRALALGAKDFLAKPFAATEVLLRIRNLLETRQLHRRLRDHNERLEEQVRARTQELVEAQLEILERLALAAEYRDDLTGQHTQRVGQLAARLAGAAGWPEAQIDLIRRAAPLHDVGKIGVPDQILLKPSALTAEEIAQMQRHTTIGARILGDSRSPLLQLAETIALTHHERWDGTGYPAGLAGEAIPPAGRIVAIADVFDALTHARPYKAAWSAEAALAELAGQRGRQFDPHLVDRFLALLADRSPTAAGTWPLGYGRAAGQAQPDDQAEGAGARMPLAPRPPRRPRSRPPGH